MDTALLLGIVGTATGVGSLGFSVVAWTVERRDRRSDVAEERRLREEEAQLDRDRFHMEVQDRERRLHAEITAVQRGWANAGPDERRYDFTLKNLGPSWAKHVSAWLMDDDKEWLSPPVELGPIDVREEKLVTLSVQLAKIQTVENVGLWVKWSDEGGYGHIERSNLEVKL